MIRFIVLLLALVLSSNVTHASVSNNVPYGPVIGIDLGTTYSCVGIYRGGRVEIIANSQGERTTPSWVIFRGNERLVGDAAKHAFHTSPTQAIYSVKRLMGRSFDDPELQHDLTTWTFDVFNQSNRPIIRIPNQGRFETFTPEEISAMILVNMKETAEAYLGSKVTHAVLTVPAYFNDAQRQATKDAGKIAGLNILRIINEPTAAAIAYGLDRPRSEESHIIVYDLGGGTFDVSLLSVRYGVFKVLATAGDSHLGGEDFDGRLLEHFTSMYRERFGVDITQLHRSKAKLIKEVEKAKRVLSNQLVVSLEIESFYRGHDFSEILTRAKFEQLNQDLFRRTLGPVHRVLSDAKLRPEDIDDVVLVGGSTRIPRIRELLKEMFGGKEPSQGINPDEAVAIGAAISAGMLSGEEGLRDVNLIDICPFTIGIETADGIFTPFIHRNTPIPATNTKILSTMEDNQSIVSIQVYEGEHSKTQENTLIGEFELSGVQPAARGVPRIEVGFEIDVNNILRVKAKEKFTGRSNSIVISSHRRGLNEDDLKQFITRSEQYSLDDAARLLRTQKFNDLQAFLWDLESKIHDKRGVTSMALKGANWTDVVTTIHETVKWMEEHKVTATSDELEEKLAIVKSIAGLE